MEEAEEIDQNSLICYCSFVVENILIVDFYIFELGLNYFVQGLYRVEIVDCVIIVVDIQLGLYQCICFVEAILHFVCQLQSIKNKWIFRIVLGS